MFKNYKSAAWNMSTQKTLLLGRISSRPYAHKIFLSNFGIKA